MDNSRIIHPVVANHNWLSKISINGGHLSDALVNFSLQKLEDGKSYNIELDLEDFSEHLFKEQLIPFISSHNISVSQCLNLKDQLLQKNIIFLDIKQLSDNVITFLIIITLQKIILLGVHILITLQRTYNILNQKVDSLHRNE